MNAWMLLLALSVGSTTPQPGSRPSIETLSAENAALRTRLDALEARLSSMDLQAGPSDEAPSTPGLELTEELGCRAFVDVPPGHPYHTEIMELLQLGITRGCAADPCQYCPDESVTRGEMAVFLVRLNDLRNGELRLHKADAIAHHAPVPGPTGPTGLTGATGPTGANGATGPTGPPDDRFIHFSRVDDDVYITGANLHLVNGTGTTWDAPNALGNLIIGYNEERGAGEDDRSGSHMLVVGSNHNYSGFGGVVAGVSNESSGAYATVCGGADNTASGEWSSVCGGIGSLASGAGSSVCGGADNTASGEWSSVCGGTLNLASGQGASVSGGADNTAENFSASVCGGASNVASGLGSSVSAGRGNEAAGVASTISGACDLTTRLECEHLP